MKKPLTHPDLITTARAFCSEIHSYPDLFGVTDGKAVGTFIEHKIQGMLEALYDAQAGSSALGLDLPSIETDIKVTSIRQPNRPARFDLHGRRFMALAIISCCSFMKNKTIIRKKLPS